MQRYDFVVIGSGPAGHRGAIQAAKLGRSVLLVEQQFRIGGSCVHTGTIPSKTLREAVLYLTGWRQRGFYGRSYRLKQRVTAEDLMQRLDITVRHEIETLQHKLHRNYVATVAGRARFETPHRLCIDLADGESRRVEAARILIATGSRPLRPAGIPFNGENILDSDEIVRMRELPRNVVIVGAGVIGVEYAAMLSALDIHVTLIDGREEVLGFLDREIVGEFVHHLRDRGVDLRFGERVATVQALAHPPGVRVTLASGKRVRADLALFTAGRCANTDALAIELAGLAPDDKGRLRVDEHLRTAAPHIYAAGDVIGFPALASTSMEQGRRAACHAFGGPLLEAEGLPSSPFGIYAVPEMSFIGHTEEELRAAGVPYESGIARFRETSRGQILGLREGLLKLLFALDDQRLLGVHIVGEGATELVHIGQAVMAHGGKLEFFVNAVFNFPTLAEAYKMAALDAYNKMADYAQCEPPVAAAAG